MQENSMFMTSLYEADSAFRSMKEGLDKLEASLRAQDELTELISLCMLQVNLGSMQNPMPVTMKLMELNLPVWPAPSRCADELEEARDREAEKAGKLLEEIEAQAVRCEENLEKASRES